jgi:hypothetical protein
VSELETRKVHFKSLTDSIDTSTPAGWFFFHVMASLRRWSTLAPGRLPPGPSAIRAGENSA